MPSTALTPPSDAIQVSQDGSTVWVHTDDGTVGRFSKKFGMDVHNTVQAQLDGAAQCLACTHERPTQVDWLEFCRLMAHHFDILVPTDLIHVG